ncbi:hypothetical protein J3B02_001505 [Coemansia erecta]|nr:hypothetical protein J3B02_001505 [Coemansia erecta]
MDQIYDLIMHIRQLNGKEFRLGIRDTWQWCNLNCNPDQYKSFPDIPFKSILSNSTPEYRVVEQIINAHVNTVHVKYRYARGRYSGAQNIAGGWKMDVDRKRLLRAMIFNAFFGKKGGVLMNLLLDSGFNRNQFHKALPSRLRGQYSFVSANVFRNMVADAKIIYGRISVQPHTGVFNTLWQTNNVDAGVSLISEIVTGKTVGENKKFDQAVASLCLNLMHVARMCNDHECVWEVFRICHPWVKRSTSAFNILIYADAKACNLNGVVRALKTMRASGALPNAVTWTTIISGMCMSGRLEGAKKLFALHLDSLPYPDETKVGVGSKEKMQDDSYTGLILYAPIMDTVGPDPNLWQQWYMQNSRDSKLDPFISTWIREIASEYHNKKAQSRISRTKGSAALAKGGNIAVRHGQGSSDPDNEAPGYIVPWMPTLATHKIIIKTLAREMQTEQAILYFDLLKSVWPQYGKWAMVKRHSTQFVDPSDKLSDMDYSAAEVSSDINHADGLRSLERILYGHLAEHRSDVRELYGLGPVEPAETANQLAARFYQSHCQRILEMISCIGSSRQGHRRVSDFAEKPVYVEKLVFAKSLHAYALEGDMPTILHHMQRYPQLIDIAVWTSVIRCICVQVLSNSDEQEILYPLFDISEELKPLVPQHILDEKRPNWVTFVLIMASIMASKGMHFTQVTFGTLIHTAAKLSDLMSILQVIEFMHSHSNVPFNVDMLRMILTQEFSFERKCDIVKSFLAASRSRNDVESDGLMIGRMSTINVDSKLLTFVVRLVQRPEDFLFLRDLVDVFAKKCGLQLGEMDYRFIIIKCRELGLQDEANYWTLRLTN